MISVHCPSCGNSAEVPESAAGKSARCGQCQQAFRVEPEILLKPSPGETQGRAPDFKDSSSAAQVPPGNPSRSRSKSGRGGNNASLIGLGAVGLALMVICVTVFSRGKQADENTGSKSPFGAIPPASPHAKATQQAESTETAEKENWKLATEKAELADIAGRLWCQGDETQSEANLKRPFLGDNQVYNVIFTRKKKDTHGNETEKIVNVDESRKGPIGHMEHTREERDLHLEYALAEGGTVELVMAVRSISQKDGDPLNEGGAITVFVRARHDRYFERAEHPHLSSVTPPEGSSGSKNLITAASTATGYAEKAKQLEAAGDRYGAADMYEKAAEAAGSNDDARRYNMTAYQLRKFTVRPLNK